MGGQEERRLLQKKSGLDKERPDGEKKQKKSRQKEG